MSENMSQVLQRHRISEKNLTGNGILRTVFCILSVNGLAIPVAVLDHAVVRFASERDIELFQVEPCGNQPSTEAVRASRPNLMVLVRRLG